MTRLDFRDFSCKITEGTKYQNADSSIGTHSTRQSKDSGGSHPKTTEEGTTDAN